MKKILLPICFLLLCFLGNTQNVKSLRIDPEYAQGGSASQIFDSVTYIPLETTENSVFGDIHDLQISRHYFAFYDDDTKAIYVFDKQGKFRSKIDKGDLDKHFAWGQFFSGIDKFVLSAFSERIFIVYDDGTSTEGRKELAVFSPDGKLLESRKLNSIFNNLQTSFCFIDSCRAIFASERVDSSSKYYFHIIKDFDSIVGNIGSKRKNDPMSKSYYSTYALRSSSSNGSVWSRHYDKAIYHLNGLDSIESYSVILPKSISLDSSFYKDSSLVSSVPNVQKYLYRHRDKVSDLTGLFFFKKLFFFGLMKYNTTTFRDNYMYSLNTGSLFKIYAVTPDRMCYFLPLFSGSPVGVDNENIYASISSLQMFQSYEATKSKHPDYPPVLKHYFATQSRKSNPVIVQLKPMSLT